MFISWFRITPLVRSIALILIAMSLLASGAKAEGKKSQPEDVISAEVQAQNSKDWDSLPKHWITHERASLESFFANDDNRLALRGYFNMQSAKLIGIQEIPMKDAGLFVDISSYQKQYQGVRLFYTAIEYSITQEDKFHFNGTNYRLMVVVQEDGEWRLAEMSEAPVEAILAIGKGFSSNGEADAIKVRKARAKGEIINPRGKQLGKNAADINEERQRRGNNPVPPDAMAATASTPVPPSMILVRMTKNTNLVWYGCNRECIIGVNFTTYIRNVLPNEWSDSNFPFESLKAGAMAVKHFGWFRVLNPKYPGQGFDAYDDTRDQTYIAGTAKTWANSAIDAVAGIGMYRTNSRDIFQSQYVRGNCICDGGKSTGVVQQLGSWYQARDKGMNYVNILRYYYDYATDNLAGQTLSLFVY